MILTQHYLACLSHASYLIGDESTGRAVIIDPRRDVGIYLEEAAERGLRIERVIETHVHADFVSGHLELAARTGAVICYGAGAEVGFPIEALHDGQRLSLGEVMLEILATPGHTSESICVVVWEHTDAPAPHGVLTGDTLFVGDVGRPDLLAPAGAGLSAEALARRLYRSLHGKLLVLPDATRVYPAHGAGSACGKALSTETTSTIGEQRRTNYALQGNERGRRNWASRSGCCFPSTVLALPCRLYPAPASSLATVRAVTWWPCLVSSPARFAVDLVVQRSGDIGSPLVSGSTSASSAGISPASRPARPGRPPPGPRTLPPGSAPDSISALPRRTVFTSAPVARAITATPPPPSA